MIARNLEDYQDAIKEVFTDYGLAFFIDGKESMRNHPLIELIRSTLDIIKGNWRYEAVFRCIKTELLFPGDKPKERVREQVDQLENYCIAYGIQGNRWTSSEPFVYRRYTSLDEDFAQTDREIETENMLNELKDWIVPPVHRLQKRLKKRDR